MRGTYTSEPEKSSGMVMAEEEMFDPEEMSALYASVGWEGYTRDVDRLCRGLANSHLVVTARNDAGALLGLARTISDDEHICYVKDVVVDPPATGRASAGPWSST
ncbi:hypothetical protein [Streptomyces virginiae]|uniref:hypothetical protein n=1 Tax=Streptomyces virginiae TaxID=1961 RepID=UPI002252B1CA|nr:hypothetical protein [Streptomyces virginiae]MCX5272639.1 hypothetical protein [Streptomyces virginiae]